MLHQDGYVAGQFAWGRSGRARWRCAGVEGVGTAGLPAPPVRAGPHGSAPRRHAATRNSPGSCRTVATDRCEVRAGTGGAAAPFRRHGYCRRGNAVAPAHRTDRGPQSVLPPRRARRTGSPSVLPSPGMRWAASAGVSSQYAKAARCRQDARDDFTRTVYSEDLICYSGPRTTGTDVGAESGWSMAGRVELAQAGRTKSGWWSCGKSPAGPHKPGSSPAGSASPRTR